MGGRLADASAVVGPRNALFELRRAVVLVRCVRGARPPPAKQTRPHPGRGLDKGPQIAAEEYGTMKAHLQCLCMQIVPHDRLTLQTDLIMVVFVSNLDLGLSLHMLHVFIPHLTRYDAQHSSHKNVTWESGVAPRQEVCIVRGPSLMTWSMRLCKSGKQCGDRLNARFNAKWHDNTDQRHRSHVLADNMYDTCASDGDPNQ